MRGEGIHRMALFTCIGLLWFGDAPAAAQGIEGRWAGSIEVVGQVLPFVVVFTETDGALNATIDIQGATGIALQDVVFEPPAVRFALQAGPGLAQWDGELAGDSISGAFTQAGLAGTFAMGRAETEPEPEREPPPYDEEEVEFANGDVTLAGTLSTPRTPGRHAAVVMITGSGPQNRAEQLFGDYRPLYDIADHLTRRGVAVLRYDDRGVGGSTGSTSQSTSEDFAGDVLAAVALLQTRENIAPDRIGVLGHSEGGLVGPLAASRSEDIAFVVMLAGPGLTGAEILFAQGELIIRANGGTDEDVELQKEVQRRLFHALRTGDGWEAAREVITAQVEASLAAMTDEQRAAIEDVAAFTEQRVTAAVQTVDNRWFRFFIDHDPVPALEVLDVPVLGLFGEFDLQVPAQVNHDAIAAAFQRSGHPDYTLEILPDANHLFLVSGTGSPSEYATMDRTYVPGFLEKISDWILARVAVPAP